MQIRHDFHEGLEDLEREVLAMGRYSEKMVAEAVHALVHRDEALAEKVIADDDALDDRYLAIEQEWLKTMALQTPVAGDLRLMSVVLHTNHSVERIGDQAVSTAAAVRTTAHLPPDSGIAEVIEELGDRARGMLRTALDSLERRSLELALSLPALLRPVNTLAKSMVERVAALAGQPDRLEAGIRIVIVARNLERVAARAVDIAEQVAFLLSGEFREFVADDWEIHDLVTDADEH